MVGTGGCFAIGIDIVVGREPGCWFDKGLVGLMVRIRRGVAGKEQGWV